MDAAMLNRFLEKLAQSPDMLREFVEFAARHGIDLTAGELSGSELDGVAGGLSVPSPLGMLQTQSAPSPLSMLQTQQATLQSLSNISSLLHTMRRSTILNMR